MTIDESISSEQDERDLMAFLHVLWSYKYLIASIAVLGAGLAAVLALVTTPIYRAEVAFSEVREGNLGNTNALMTQLGGLANIAGATLGGMNGLNPENQGVLRSRRLAEEFINRNGLLQQLTPADGQPPTLWSAVLDFRTDVLAIRDENRNDLSIITVDWTDPVTAARWANDFVGLANEIIRARAMDEAKQNIAYLSSRVAETNVVGLQRVMYNLIETETKNLMLANSREEYAFRIIDPAVAPETRIRPRRTLMVLVGGLIGLVMGVLGAIALNSLKKSGNRAERRS